jgi:hypothetical protein
MLPRRGAYATRRTSGDADGPFGERTALVLRFGERGLEMFLQANGLDRETAIRELQRQRQAGRTPSKCMSELIG